MGLHDDAVIPWHLKTLLLLACLCLQALPRHLYKDIQLQRSFRGNMPVSLLACADEDGRGQAGRGGGAAGPSTRSGAAAVAQRAQAAVLVHGSSGQPAAGTGLPPTAGAWTARSQTLRAHSTASLCLSRVWAYMAFGSATPASWQFAGVSVGRSIAVATQSLPTDMGRPLHACAGGADAGGTAAPAAGQPGVPGLPADHDMAMEGEILLITMYHHGRRPPWPCMAAAGWKHSIAKPKPLGHTA